MDTQTATAALEYVLNIANRRQLRIVAKLAVRSLIAHLQPDELAQVMSEISGSLIERDGAA